MDEDHAYRAMDLPINVDTASRVQEAVYFAVAALLDLEVDLCFLDTMPESAAGMITAVLGAGVLAGWSAADEGYGTAPHSH